MDEAEIKKIIDEIEKELTGDPEHDIEVLNSWGERYREKPDSEQLLQEIGMRMFDLYISEDPDEPQRIFDDMVETADEDYEEACRLIEQKRYDEAEAKLAVLTEVIKAYPLSDDAVWTDFTSYLEGMVFQDYFSESIGDREVRRVPVHFYTVVEKGVPARAIAFDDEGHRAMTYGPVPERAKRQGLTREYLTEQMYKTGGTPYSCVENQAKVDEGLYLPAAAINELRRRLINELSENRAKPPQRRVLTVPPMPKNLIQPAEPKIIFQVRTAEQLTRELAELKPDYLYFPALELAEEPEKLLPLSEFGITPVAVLPRIITDTEAEPVRHALEKLFDAGVGEALVGNLGHIYLARAAGMKLRGDFGLNAFNAQTLDMLSRAGFISATSSFELRLSQIKSMPKPLDTEAIIYGRLPLMVSDQCVIRHSAGHCNCQMPAQMADRMGSVFPVVKEYGCRNVIYNAHKLYLADKKDDLYSAGLWAVRLMFTTESPRECVEVARGHLGLSDYKPNVLTRGLYYRGVE